MAIDVVVEEVADNLEEIAQATRAINSKSLGLIVGGVVVGVAVGYYIGKRRTAEKARAEAFEESEIEVRQIRELYEQRATAHAPKPPIEEIIEEKGYGVIPDRPLRAPVPVREPAPLTIMDVEEESTDGWNYPEEIQKRSAHEPYIIHDEERGTVDGYSHVNFTYYVIDGVLVDDEDERPVSHPDLQVGQENLRFGHGSGDPNVVFIRNDALQTEIEVSRLDRSYEEDVLGHTRADEN